MTGNDILASIEIDDDAKEVFLHMPREEQLTAIFGMLAYLRNEAANTKKEVLNLKLDFKKHEQQQNDYRILREKEELQVKKIVRSLLEKENSGHKLEDIEPNDLVNTTQKVIQALNNRFWFMNSVFKFLSDIFKSVLITIITIITLAVLYLAFGGKMP